MTLGMYAKNYGAETVKFAMAELSGKRTNGDTITNYPRLLRVICQGEQRNQSSDNRANEAPWDRDRRVRIEKGKQALQRLKASKGGASEPSR